MISKKSRTGVFFLAMYNINGLSGTPKRTKTVFEAVKKKFGAKLLLPGISKSLSLGSPSSKKTKQKLVKKLIPNCFKRTIKQLKAFKQLISFRPKVIHAFLEDAAFVACLYKIIFGGRVVYEMHGVGGQFSWKKFSIMEYMSVKLSDHIIVMSHRMKKIVEDKYGVSSKKVSVMWGPIDMQIFKHSKRKKSKSFTVCYGGNDSKYQGVETMLEAARKLESKKNIRFKFIGFEKKGHPDLENVEYFGVIPDDKLFIKSILDSDVFLSCYEGGTANYAYPHKLSTYLCLGRPVIASDVSDCKIILRKSKAGETFEAGDSDQLVEKIISFSKLSNKQLDEMCSNAVEFAKNNFSVSKICSELEGLYFKESK
jgi:glycosyltransferase involved in cell wall biosynthesis